MEDSGGTGGAASEIFGMLWSVWKEMFGVVFSILPKVIFFTLWILSGIIIMPCVLVANHIFPAWSEWGGGF